jgi:Rrf2 family transcriptional regulator, nitric oxide-sensitive transcriptional repressor
MFSQTVEYALRTVICLAEGSPSSFTTEQIAEKTLVPKAYLSKVIQGLCVSGVLASKRGAGGGVSLAKKPSELTILDVVNAVEPIVRIQQCPLGLKSHGVHLCPLHRKMDQALESVETAFRTTTLADVLAEPTLSYPLCERVN